ncbi:MAG TPA: DUF1573 domain-containing protein [Terriglobales bacterium]|nr:DUF1573 domain-containing protein [Terriglobales bacterium]
MRTRTLYKIALGAGLTALVLAGTGGLAAATKARAAFKETAHDFGKVKQGEVLTHEFEFRNDGTDALVVERVETTCGCTAALVSEKEVKPGKAGKIKVTMDTHGYAGRMTRYVYLVSNDTQDSRRELSVSADIEVPPQPKIELDRYNIDLGLSLEGEAPSAKVVIHNDGELELSIEMAHEQVKFFAGGKPAQFPIVIPAGRSAEVEFRFPPQTQVGSLRDYVIVRSNDTYRSTQTISFSRYVVTKKALRDLFLKYRSVLDEKR